MSLNDSAHLGKPLVDGAAASQSTGSVPVMKEWGYIWYGSEPYKGYTIIKGDGEHLYVGGDESLSAAMDEIVNTHNMEMAALRHGLLK